MSNISKNVSGLTVFRVDALKKIKLKIELARLSLSMSTFFNGCIDTLLSGKTTRLGTHEIEFILTPGRKKKL